MTQTSNKQVTLNYFSSGHPGTWNKFLKISLVVVFVQLMSSVPSTNSTPTPFRFPTEDPTTSSRLEITNLNSSSPGWYNSFVKIVKIQESLVLSIISSLRQKYFGMILRSSLVSENSRSLSILYYLYMQFYSII